MRKLLRRLFYWTHQQQLEDDLAEELEFHRAMRQEQLGQVGRSPEAAAAGSYRALGNASLAIRSGLGAGPVQIAAALLRETAKALAIGSVIGVVLMFAGRRVLASVMENMNLPSLGNVAAALLIIAGVTLAAVLLPTIRAVRMSIVDALRVE